MPKTVTIEQDIQPRLTLAKKIDELRQRRKQLEIEANYQLGVVDGHIQAIEETLKEIEAAEAQPDREAANGQAKD
jgi:hypothetical protein